MTFCYHSQHCAYCVDCDGLYASFYANRCNNSTHLRHCAFCDGCSDCLFCVNLKNKTYHILNQSYSKEEYQTLKNKILTNKQLFETSAENYTSLLKKSIRLYTNNISCENCTGDMLTNSKNSLNCYDAMDLEDCVNLDNSGDCRDCRDLYAGYWNSTLCYEGMEVQGYNVLFSCNCLNDNKFLLYCHQCMNGCAYCFGCSGLKNKQYCILNKQYTKEAYEHLVPRIIQHMEES